jgi:hypothetical protein
VAGVGGCGQEAGDGGGQATPLKSGKGRAPRTPQQQGPALEGSRIVSVIADAIRHRYEAEDSLMLARRIAAFFANKK